MRRRHARIPRRTATQWPVEHRPTRATTDSHILTTTGVHGGEDAPGTNTIKLLRDSQQLSSFRLISFRTIYRSAVVTSYRTEYFPTFGCYQRIVNTSCERRFYAHMQW